MCALALVLLAGCSSDDPSLRSATGPSVTDRSSSPPSSSDAETEEVLLYLERKELVQRDLATDETESLGKLPVGGATASPDGSAVAYVVDEGASDEEDFVADPELHVRALEGGGDTTVGPGLSPAWHPSGERLAYLEPGEARECEGEVCEGSSSVVVADLIREERRTLLRDGRWGLFGWAGDDLLAAEIDDSAQAPEIIAVSPDGEIRPEGFPPSELWGAAPDGSLLVVVEGGRTALAPVGGGAPVEIELGGGVLGEGSWSPSADRFGAVLLAGPNSTLVLVDTTGGVTEVQGSRGAAGPVLWGPDGASFVYVRQRGLRLEAVHCASASDCETLFDWPRGITLLALSERSPQP